MTSMFNRLGEVCDHTTISGGIDGSESAANDGPCPLFVGEVAVPSGRARNTINPATSDAIIRPRPKTR